MKIEPIRKVGKCRTNTLEATYESIVKVLGHPNVTDLDDKNKVYASWGFKLDNEECGLWSYKTNDPIRNEVWSFYGSNDALDKLYKAMQ